MRIRIKPLDTLFFRDGKPFSMGEESWADGIFPPYPSVLYGALRTWYIANKDGVFGDDIIKESEGIKISGIHYRLEDGLYLPMPMDMVEPKEKEREEEREEEREQKYRVVKLALRGNYWSQEQKMSNYLLNSLLVSADGEDVDAIEEGFMEANDFKQYLEGTLQETKIRKLKDMVKSEPKVGIGRDRNTNTAQEGKLYRVGMRRAIDFEIITELQLPFEGIGQHSTFIKMGAEGKTTAFDNLKGRIDALRIDRDTVTLKTGRFKLYLATPAIFDKNKKSFKDKSDHKTELLGTAWEPNLRRLGIQAELKAAALGKPIHIGGFDMAKRKPKPMMKAIPAGSVYYYETQEPVEKIITTLQGKSVSNYLGDQGFGLAYIGNY